MNHGKRGSKIRCKQTFLNKYVDKSVDKFANPLSILGILFVDKWLISTESL